MCELQLSPDEFWDLSPHAWGVLIEGHREQSIREQLELGIQTWFSGMAAQMDFKKTNFNQWMRQFEEQDKVKKQDREALNEGQQLWANLTKSSERLL